MSADKGEDNGDIQPANAPDQKNVGKPNPTEKDGDQRKVARGFSDEIIDGETLDAADDPAKPG